MAYIEICAANYASVVAAGEGGAYRIELCSGLESGGLTPSPGLIKAAVAHLDIPVFVLIRPREGDFCYSPGEVELMLEDIRFCREAGAAGVVVGALTPQYELDAPVFKAMMAAAGPLQVVCHRAFDFTADPNKSLEQLIDWGVVRVLSSGQKASAWEGRENLAAWVREFGDRIQIMPGSGISDQNIQAIQAHTRAQHFHFSARKWVEQANLSDIPGLPAGIFVSDAEMIRQCVTMVNN